MIRCLVAGIVAWGLAGSAVAHPLSRDQWSLRTAVRLAGDDAQVVVVLEVPFDVVGRAVREARAADPDTPVDRLLEAYGHAMLERLAAEVRLTVDGQPVPGAFGPKEHPLNGRGSASGGFFTWIVEFTPTGAWPLDGDVVVQVVHQDFADVGIVYSAFVDGGSGWRVAEDSSKAVLPEGTYRMDDPAFWSADPRLRTLRARFLTATE